MVKKAKWLFDGKNQFFKILKSKISKILKFCGLREILQAKTFDTFHASKLKFSKYICSILGILQENKESNSHRLIQKPEVLPQNWEKRKIL